MAGTTNVSDVDVMMTGVALPWPWRRKIIDIVRGGCQLQKTGGELQRKNAKRKEGREEERGTANPKFIEVVANACYGFDVILATRH